MKIGRGGEEGERGEGGVRGDRNYEARSARPRGGWMDSEGRIGADLDLLVLKNGRIAIITRGRYAGKKVSTQSTIAARLGKGLRC